nr:reverse transcriptase domain-containing protein [Tanacetum cinerariifolium]
MQNNVKTYNESDDPEDHLKILQAAAKVERWAMPTWCHMFNSTLTGSAMVWFDDLPSKFVDSYDDLKKAFLANFLQQKKCIKDLVEIHHIKQREGESMEDFMQRFKNESRHPKASKKGEAFEKDKPLEILMVQPWQRVSRQMITQSFSPNLEILFPPLGDEDEAKRPMIIEAEIGDRKHSLPPSHQAAEERIKVAIHPEYPDQTITIGSTLTKEGRKALCEHDSASATPSGALIECPRRMPSSQAKEKNPSTEKEKGNIGRSSKTYGC